MKKYPRQFRLDNIEQLNILQQQLSTLMPLHQSDVQIQHSIYYDSFDWRLYKKHTLLVAEPSDEGSLLYTQNLLSGKRSEMLSVSDIPRFAWDLPESALRHHLDGLLEMRALLAQLKISVHIQQWWLMDVAQNPLLSLRLETPKLHPAGRPAKTLPTSIHLNPIKGKGKIARKISDYLRQDLSLQIDDTPLPVRILQHSDKEPGSYSSKLNLQLSPDMRANQAAKFVMKTLLATLRDNEAGVQEDLDSEFLHDYRVAVRRTRTALTQIPFVLPKSMIERMRARFAQLGDITGPTRDLDVYLLKFDDYRAMLPEHMQADLTPLHEYLQQHRALELGRLQRYLQTATYKKFIRDWQVFLNAPARPHHQLINSARPIKALADERIWKAYRKIMKRGSVIQLDTPVEELHDLRKQGKKLRYLLEFFQSLYPPKEMNKLIKILKNLQENLGDLQDYEVQAYYLRGIADELGQQTSVGTATLLAMGMLVGQLEQLQQQAREEFAIRFKTFAQKSHQQLFAKFFKPVPSSQPEPIPFETPSEAHSLRGLKKLRKE